MTKLSAVIFSMSSSNIRNANGVFGGTYTQTKEQKKLSNIAKRASKAKRESMKPGLQLFSLQNDAAFIRFCVIINT